MFLETRSQWAEYTHTHRRLLQRDGEQPHPPACEGGTTEGEGGEREERESEERRREGGQMRGTEGERERGRKN